MCCTGCCRVGRREPLLSIVAMILGVRHVQACRDAELCYRYWSTLLTAHMVQRGRRQHHTSRVCLGESYIPCAKVRELLLLLLFFFSYSCLRLAFFFFTFDALCPKVINRFIFQYHGTPLTSQTYAMQLFDNLDFFDSCFFLNRKNSSSCHGAPTRPSSSLAARTGRTKVRHLLTSCSSPA